MVLRQYLALFLLGHLISDYYLESISVLRRRERMFSWVRLHCIVYLLCMVVVFLPYFSWMSFIGCIAVSLLHFSIDVLVYCLLRNVNPQKHLPLRFRKRVFVIEQVLSVIIIIFVSFILSTKGIRLTPIKPFSMLFNALEIDGISVASWLFVLLAIHKLPA